MYLTINSGISTMKIENIKWTWSFYWATLLFSRPLLPIGCFFGFFWLFMVAYPGEQHSQSIHFHHHEVHEYWLLWPVQLLLHANSCWILLEQACPCALDKLDYRAARSQRRLEGSFLKNQFWGQFVVIFWMKQKTKR